MDAVKKLLFVLLAILLAACRATEGDNVLSSATSPPKTAVPVATLAPTNTPLPTNTPIPTNTPQPTPTTAPTWEPAAIADIETALGEAGYRRFPFTAGGGVTAFNWFSDNSYERVTTWADGYVELRVLHGNSASTRAKNLERHLAILDPVLPSGFMEELRQEHAAYNRSVEPSVTGDPVQVNTYADDFQTVWGEYNPSETGIGGYYVWFSLWWVQSTCPSYADSCYYPDFPGLEFTGDTSLVFHTVQIALPE